MDRDTLTGLGNERKLMRDMGTAPASAGAAGTHLTVFDLEGFKHYNDSYGRACGDVMLRRLAGRLAAAIGPDAEAYRTQGDEFAVLDRGPAAAVAATVERAASALVELGEGFMIRAWHGSVSLPEDTEFPGDALKLADQRLQQHRHDPRTAQTPELALRTATRVPIAEPAYGPGDLARQVGERLGIAGDELSDLVAATELRDVGMMAVPDSVQLVEGGLSLDDRRLIRLHTVVGERLLTANFGMGSVAAIVRSSHEQFDGRGYPDALAGDDIPLAARVVFACGVFSDLTAERPHRHALSPAEAFAEVRRHAGVQFDPAVIDALVQVVQVTTAAPRFVRRAATVAA